MAWPVWLAYAAKGLAAASTIKGMQGSADSKRGRLSPFGNRYKMPYPDNDMLGTMSQALDLVERIYGMGGGSGGDVPKELESGF